MKVLSNRTTKKTKNRGAVVVSIVAGVAVLGGAAALIACKHPTNPSDPAKESGQVGETSAETSNGTGGSDSQNPGSSAEVNDMVTITVYSLSGFMFQGKYYLATTNLPVTVTMSTSDAKRYHVVDGGVYVYNASSDKFTVKD